MEIAPVINFRRIQKSTAFGDFRVARCFSASMRHPQVLEWAASSVWELFRFQSWPKAPAEIVEKLNKEINAGLTNSKIKARLADVGGTALSGSPADFGKLIADETEKWGKVVKFAGIKADWTADGARYSVTSIALNRCRGSRLWRWSVPKLRCFWENACMTLL
jgi:hypothetical protein